MTPKYLSPRKGRQHPLLPSHLITQQKQSFRKDTGHAQGQGHPAHLSVPTDILLGPLGLLMSPNSSATALTATKIFLADSLAPPEPGEAAEKRDSGPRVLQSPKLLVWELELRFPILLTSRWDASRFHLLHPKMLKCHAADSQSLNYPYLFPYLQAPHPHPFNFFSPCSTTQGT